VFQWAKRKRYSKGSNPKIEKWVLSSQAKKRRGKIPKPKGKGKGED